MGDDHQEIERLRQELDEKLLLLETVQSGIKVVALDPPTITFWNRSSEAIYGFSAAEALGQHPGELLKTRFGVPMDQVMAEVMRTGSWRGEVSETRKDGVEQVLLNLASNACKFTQHGVVELTARRDFAGVTIEVCDSGIGIPLELQPRLFQPFVQGDDSLTRRHGGTGLGLAIARQLCDLMGATITVASAPGRGSTFTVRLPG